LEIVIIGPYAEFKVPKMHTKYLGKIYW